MLSISRMTPPAMFTFISFTHITIITTTTSASCSMSASLPLFRPFLSLISFPFSSSFIHPSFSVSFPMSMWWFCSSHHLMKIFHSNPIFHQFLYYCFIRLNIDYISTA
eukprot:364717_1